MGKFYFWCFLFHLNRYFFPLTRAVLRSKPFSFITWLPQRNDLSVVWSPFQTIICSTILLLFLFRFSLISQQRPCLFIAVKFYFSSQINMSLKWFFKDNKRFQGFQEENPKVSIVCTNSCWIITSAFALMRTLKTWFHFSYKVLTWPDHNSVHTCLRLRGRWRTCSSGRTIILGSVWAFFMQTFSSFLLLDIISTVSAPPSLIQWPLSLRPS